MVFHDTRKTQFFLCMRFLKYSLLKPCFGSLPLLASVFSSLDLFEFCEEGAGAEDAAVFWSDLGRSCSWVRARPRLQEKEQRSKCILYDFITVVGWSFHDVYGVKNTVRKGHNPYLCYWPRNLSYHLGKKRVFSYRFSLCTITHSPRKESKRNFLIFPAESRLILTG